MKKFNIDKIKAAQISSAIFSILGIIGTIGSFMVEDTCTKAAIDEAVEERLKERGL